MSTTSAESILVQLIRAAFPFGESEERLPDFDNLDWPSLVETAAQHGLAPLAFAALKKCGLLKVAPPVAVETLRLAYVRASVGNRLAFDELSVLLDCFERAKTDVVILKGGALAQTLYDEIALRPMGDLDLLIHRQAIVEVEAALIKQGYHASSEITHHFSDEFSAERTFLRMGKRPSQIDLHWHVFTTAYYFERVPIEWFWQRTVEIGVNNRRALTFSPAAQLLYLSSHFMLHQYRRLIWSYDLALLIGRFESSIDWEEVIEAAASFGLSQVVSEALAEVRERWGVSVPYAERRLRAAQTAWKDRVMFAALALPSGGEIGFVSGLSMQGIRKKLAFGLRLVFPSPGYMRTRFQIRSRPSLLFCYLWRAARSGWLIGRGSLLLLRAAISSRSPGA